MEGSGGEEVGKTFSRRTLLKVAAGTAGVLIADSILGHPLLKILGVEQGNQQSLYPDPPQYAPEETISKESLVEYPTDFGFNTHLHVNPLEGDNLTIDNFKQNVDILAANNQKAIRLNFMDWDVIAEATPSKITWSDKLSIYEEALAYAKSKGLGVTLVTSTPAAAKDFSKEDYLSVTRDFYTTLARRFADKVDVWQLFNEADIHNFKNYEFNKDQTLVDGYLTELSGVVRAAYEAIKAINPDAKTTINVSRWVGHNTDLIKKGSMYLDALGQYADIISLNLYPDRDEAEIARLPGYVEYFQRRYNKPVIVSELGLPTYNQFTENDQGKFVKMAIDSIKGGKVQPRELLLYELTDETLNTGAENSFGFLHTDGAPKSSFDEVVSSMQNNT